LAFGERYCLENAMSDLAKVSHQGAKEALRTAIYLHCVCNVRNNVAWYLIFNAAVKAVVPHLNDLVEALGLPNIQDLHSPIVRDYVAFNA